MSVFLNVQIQVKYGQLKAKYVYQSVLRMKSIHMKRINVNQDVIQVKSGKLKSVYLIVQMPNIFPMYQILVNQNAINLKYEQIMVVNHDVKIKKNGMITKIIAQISANQINIGKIYLSNALIIVNQMNNGLIISALN